jgi:hypothetical protein
MVRGSASWANGNQEVWDQSNNPPAMALYTATKRERRLPPQPLQVSDL